MHSNAVKIAYRAIFVIVSCLLLLYGCAEKEAAAGERMSETRLLLDTFCTITVAADNPEDSRAAILLGEAFDLCMEYEALFSITDENSDVWRVNHAGGGPVAVAQQTLELAGRGIEFGELSDGRYDITIGRLSRLWDFKAPGGENKIPGKDELEQARKTVDYRKVSSGTDTLQLQDSQAWLDLGGIAKGYIAGEIAAFLTGRGITSALVDLGGDIVAVGNRPDGEPWRLGVRKPYGGSEEYIGVLKITDAAVVSSGIYERMFEENGEIYHHIIDPSTGMPAKSDVISATIIAADAVTGEGLSTIAVLAGSREIEGICRQVPGFIGAVLILDDFEIVTFGDVDIEY